MGSVGCLCNQEEREIVTLMQIMRLMLDTGLTLVIMVKADMVVKGVK